MRRLRWAAFLALFGVLLHVSLVAQHNSVSLASKLSHATLSATIGVICHGGADGSGCDTELPSQPGPQTDWNFCPLCAGLAPAVAILSETIFDLALPVAASIRVVVRHKAIRVRIAALRPPPRGPPAFG